MPLNPASLQSALETLFEEPPPTAAECADAWADAVVGYAQAIVPPSTTVSTAVAALSTALLGAFQTPNAIPVFDAAFMTFATSVGGGMAPTHTGVPPVSPLAIATLFAAPQPTHATAAAAFASHIDLWMKTGTGTLVAPPFTVIPWS